MVRLGLVLESRTRWLGPVSLCGFLRHRTAEVVTRPICGSRPARLRRSFITRLCPILAARLRLMPSRYRRRMLEDRPGWHGSKCHHGAASDRYGRIPVSRRKRRTADHRAAVHGEQCNWPAVDRTTRQNWPRDHFIARRYAAKIRATVESRSPPRRTASEPRRPAPSKAVEIVTRSALERHIAPRVARNPEVAVTRSPHPVPVAVRIKGRARRFIRRPDISLAGHIVPVAVGVKITPCRVLRLAQILGGAGLRRRLCR